MRKDVRDGKDLDSFGCIDHEMLESWEDGTKQKAGLQLRFQESRVWVDQGPAWKGPLDMVLEEGSWEMANFERPAPPNSVMVHRDKQEIE